MKKAAILLVLLCATLNVASSQKDGILPNGNFELGPKPSEMKGTKVVNRHAIPNWEISGYVEYIKSGQTQGDMLLPVPQGDYAVRLGEDASIKTKVKVTKGVFYSISFVFARTCAQEEKLNVSVWPNSEKNDWGMLPLQTMYSSEGWDSYSWGFLAEANVIDVVIHNPAVEKDPACGPLIDFVALKALKTPKRRGGKVYDLIFSIGDASNSCEGSMLVEAFAGKITRQFPYESKGKGGFKRARLRFTAISPRTRVRFLSTYYHMKSDNSGSLCGPVVDDVRLVGVRNPHRP
ncbi:hypothetical protein RND71_006121 [Anisodus tanguticus]|uniref:DUF642 domain-containing protein n=1 Tax=Anisodus tanguticus TaxID=243964 RepID=A0AAE1VVG8_9SOLA|nr:hypothetical protein RND71_006121 [Anisodus tanguticus]